MEKQETSFLWSAGLLEDDLELQGEEETGQILFYQGAYGGAYVGSERGRRGGMSQL